MADYCNYIQSLLVTWPTKSRDSWELRGGPNKVLYYNLISVYTTWKAPSPNPKHAPSPPVKTLSMRTNIKLVKDVVTGIGRGRRKRKREKAAEPPIRRHLQAEGESVAREGIDAPDGSIPEVSNSFQAFRAC